MRFDVHFLRDKANPLFETIRSLDAVNPVQAASDVVAEFPGAVVLSATPESDKRNNRVRRDCLKLFNRIVLMADGKLARVVGYAQDNYDSYYILRRMRGEKSPTWFSAVGGVYDLTPLKRQGVVRAADGETWTNYSRLDNLMRLNGAPETDAFYEIAENDVAGEIKQAAVVAINLQCKANAAADRVEDHIVADALKRLRLDGKYFGNVRKIVAEGWPISELKSCP
jgi:hypothetical protein